MAGIEARYQVNRGLTCHGLALKLIQILAFLASANSSLS